jgi:hypothetical protein
MFFFLVAFSFSHCWADGSELRIVGTCMLSKSPPIRWLQDVEVSPVSNIVLNFFIIYERKRCKVLQLHWALYIIKRLYWYRFLHSHRMSFTGIYSYRFSYVNISRVMFCHLWNCVNISILVLSGLTFLTTNSFFILVNKVGSHLLLLDLHWPEGTDSMHTSGPPASCHDNILGTPSWMQQQQVCLYSIHSGTHQIGRAATSHQRIIARHHQVPSLDKVGSYATDSKSFDS